MIVALKNRDRAGLGCCAGEDANRGWDLHAVNVGYIALVYTVLNLLLVMLPLVTFCRCVFC